jgi:protoporphyrinogen/coproporphyrinogen III oxidase
MTVDVAIIGAGISGLVAADDLTRRGHRVVVLERQARPGGNAVSERHAGFLMEHGPSTMNAYIPAALEISRHLGLDNQRQELGDGVRNRYLVNGGGLSAIPMGALGFLSADYLSPMARLRIMGDLFLPHRSDGEEETVMGFAARRFGREFAERVIDPLVAGLYGGRAAELSVSAIFPKLVALEEKYGSVTLGMMHRRREGGKMPGSRLFSWQDGIATLPRRLARRLGDKIRTGVAVRRISSRPGGFDIHLGAEGCLRTKSVVVATQAHVTAQLIAGIDVPGAAAAARIRTPSLAVVFLGFRRQDVAHPLDGLGFLTAEAEGRNVLGAQFGSTMFPGRAPDGHVAVTAYVGGARAPELARLPAPDLIALVGAELRDLIGVAGEPRLARVRHWTVGLPQYEPGHRGRAAALKAAGTRVPGLFLTGNYFAGPSVAACLGVARETALAAHAYLESSDGDRRRSDLPDNRVPASL